MWEELFRNLSPLSIKMIVSSEDQKRLSGMRASLTDHEGYSFSDKHGNFHSPAFLALQSAQPFSSSPAP